MLEAGLIYTYIFLFFVVFGFVWQVPRGNQSQTQYMLTNFIVSLLCPIYFPFILGTGLSRKILS